MVELDLELEKCLIQLERGQKILTTEISSDEPDNDLILQTLGQLLSRFSGLVQTIDAMKNKSNDDDQITETTLKLAKVAVTLKKNL